jgi:hypothetical protein
MRRLYCISIGVFSYSFEDSANISFVDTCWLFAFTTSFCVMRPLGSFSYSRIRRPGNATAGQRGGTGREACQLGECWAVGSLQRSVTNPTPPPMIINAPVSRTPANLTSLLPLFCRPCHHQQPESRRLLKSHDSLRKLLVNTPT